MFTVSGTVLIVIAEVVVLVLPQVLVAVRVYTPAEAVEVVIGAGLATDAVNPFGPPHEKPVAPVAEPLSVNMAPEQRIVAEGTALTTDGTVLMVIAVVVVVVLPQTLVAVNVYTPAEAVLVVIAAGLATDEVNPPGPLQENPVAPVAVPVSVNAAPEQSVVGEGVALTADGTPFTVTDDVNASVLPHVLVAVRVYTPADRLFVVIAPGLCSDDPNPLGPSQE